MKGLKLVLIKNKIIILILVCSFIHSCDNNVRKKNIDLQNQKIKVTKDNIDLVNKKIDSIIKIEEKRAIGQIKFGINGEEFLRQKENFIKLTNGQLDKYKFRLSGGFKDDGSLSNIWLNGNRIHYDYYDRDMLNQFISLKEVLFEKYGEPTKIDLNKFPSWTDFDKQEKKNIYYWSIGNKYIFVSIANVDNFYYVLNVSFGYLTHEDLDKSIKERVLNEKKSKEKALNNL